MSLQGTCSTERLKTAIGSLELTCAVIAGWVFIQYCVYVVYIILDGGHHQLVPGTAPANADIRTTLNIYGDVVTDEVSQANLFPDGPGQFVWT